MKSATAAGHNGRSYHSPLRERQSEQTRVAILEAIAQELAATGLQELHVPAIARRAGVSVRTIYRYFPTRDALLDAAEEWIDRSIGTADFSRPIDEFPAMLEEVFKQFDANETMMLAHWATSLGRDVRERGRKRRQQAYRQALNEVTSHLSRSDARAAHAVVSYLLSSRTWKAMREEFGMAGAESGKAAAWALRTLIADLRHRNEFAARTRNESATIDSQPPTTNR
jgi:AcrR family transcriptional regulator